MEITRRIASVKRIPILTSMTRKPPISSAEDLFQRLNLDESKYYGFTPLRDAKSGFSVKRKYDKGVRFRPQKNSKGVVTEFCCIWIAVIESEADTSRLQKLFIKVAIYNEMGIVESQLDTSEPRRATLFDPIEFKSHDEYVYDPEFDSFSKNGKSVTGNELFDELYEKHVRPTKPIRGFKLRSCLWLHRSIYEFLNILIGFMLVSLRFFSGRFLEKSYADEMSKFYAAIHGDYVEMFSKDDIKVVKSEEIKAFNYHTTKPVLITGSILMIGVIALANLTPISEVQIKGESALWVIIPVIVFWSIDTILPLCVLAIVNIAIYAKIKVSFKKIKI